MNSRIVCWVQFLSLLLGVTSVHGQTTLGQALEATNLVWTSGGTSNIVWFGTNYPDATAYDENDSAQSGTITHNQETWLQTTVVGPGTVTFWWKVLSLAPDALEFTISGAVQETISGDVDWSFRSFTVPAGTNTLKWRYYKDAQFNGAPDKGWVDQVTYTTNPPPALQDALNTCGVAWISGGNVNPTYWEGETNVTHDGSKAAQSGAIYHSQESWLETTVSGVTNLSFWWKVSSETNADWLEFYTNAVLAKRITGEVNWQSNFFKLTTTTQTLRWRYVKDDSVTVNQDHGWLDQVVFNPPRKAFPYTLTNPARLSDGRFQMSIIGEVGCTCRVQFSTNLALTNWTTLTNFTTASTGTQQIDNGASNSVMRFYRALSP